MEYPPNESSLQRAKRDTISYFGTVRFWIFDGFIIAGFTIWVLLWAPQFNQTWCKIMYQVMIPILGAISGLGIVFLIFLFLAPYKQRDEVREYIAEHASPLSVHKQPIHQLIPKRKVKRVVLRTGTIDGKTIDVKEVELDP